jgi:YfiH family protein
MNELPCWRSRLLESLGYVAVFYGREGGVSQGACASLNLSEDAGDDPNAMAENEARALTHLGVAGLYLPRQVHADNAVLIDEPVRGVRRGAEADAVVARRADLAVGVLTADCAPILIGALDGGAYAAIHAGWRGLLAGVIPRALLRLTRAFDLRVGDLAAAVGPTIRAADYEVDAELGRRFLQKRVDLAGVIWPDRRRKPHLDLRLMAVKDLLAAGLNGENIEIVGPPTGDPRLFSHRRDHGRTGRQLSAIGRRRQPG